MLRFFVFLVFLSFTVFSNSPKKWWENSVIYQIYPRSFQDSNNDGIGDLKGITRRISYLSDLGVDAIWLSPIHPSPDYDFGYDVSDYYSIHPQYGTMEDFEELLRECKRQNIKIMLDLVVNHTSKQHSWFQESRASLQNPKRDWYLWTSKPNNWRSRLDESAWEYDSKTQQYYMHSFFKEQPDLNWRNPQVRAEIKKIMRFWLNKGVAGFRLDLANYFLKDSELRDNPKTNSWARWGSSLAYAYHAQEHVNDKNHFPDLLDAYREIRQVADEYNAVLLGESDNDDDIAQLASDSLGEHLDGLHMAFNFKFLESSFKAKEFSEVISEWEQFLPKGAEPVYALSNHDRIRHISRYGNSEEKARLAAMLLLTLKGTSVLYYGEEIGLREAKIDWESLQDPLHQITKVASWIRYLIEKTGTYHAGPPIKRDECRTPMQWETGLHAGFSNASKPWIKMSESFDRIHVASQQKSLKSLLSLYKQLIRLKKYNIDLHEGSQTIQPQNNPDLLIYSRGKLLVALNTGNKEIELSHTGNPKILLSTHLKTSDGKKIRAFEGMIWSY